MRRSWSRRSLRYVAASVATALVGAVLLHGYLVRAAAAAELAGPTASVVVAGEAVARGSALRADELRVVRVPTAYEQPGSSSSIAQVVGRVALVDLARGEAVTKTRIARVRSGPVASLIPEGLRAFAVPTSLPPGAIVPGDHVDVLATFGSGQPHTETVVSGVEVLFVLGAQGPSGPDEGGGGSAAVGPSAAFDAAGAGAGAQVTLIVLVAPDEENRLAFARAFADLAVAIAPAP